MSFQFQKAVRGNVPLIIGLAGASGSGKTFSALKLATGLAGWKRFCVVDTESGRARHYSDSFDFDHGDLAPPFRPQRYLEAILAAEAARYPVVVVDSMSHEHAGEGGLLDWKEEETTRMAGDDWAKRERVAMAAWIKPKMAHKQMVAKLLQLRVHLILCMRAEEKVEIVKEEGKTKIVPKHSPIGLGGWMPICERNLPFEMTVSFMLTPDAPGVPKPIKLQQQHRGMLDLSKPLDESFGRQLADWAAGAPPPAQKPTMPADEFDGLLQSIKDADDLPSLERTFESAWRRAGRGSPERAQFQGVYESRKQALRAPQ